jgi:hypothetical protein
MSNIIRPALSNKARGRCIYFAIPKHLTGEETVKWVDRKYLEALEMNNKINTPEFKFPKQARRLREVYSVINIGCDTFL